MDTSVCFQRSASGAQAVLPAELEEDEFKLEELAVEAGFELELTLDVGLELAFELLMLLDLIETVEDVAFEDEVLTALLVI